MHSPHPKEEAAALSEREKFEAAMKKLFALWSFASDGCGGYHAQYTDAAWAAWQARAALAPSLEAAQVEARWIVAQQHPTRPEVSIFLTTHRQIAEEYQRIGWTVLGIDGAPFIAASGVQGKDGGQHGA